MEINVQSVIDKLANNYAQDVAQYQKSKVILEAQVEALQQENEQLKRDRDDAVAENSALKERYNSATEGPVEGEVIG